MKYRCKENDVVIKKSTGSILIGIEGDRRCGQTIVGLKDLQQALILFDINLNDAEWLIGHEDYKEGVE